MIDSLKVGVANLLANQTATITNLLVTCHCLYSDCEDELIRAEKAKNAKKKADDDNDNQCGATEGDELEGEEEEGGDEDVEVVP